MSTRTVAAACRGIRKTPDTCTCTREELQSQENIADKFSVDTACRLIAAHVLLPLQRGSPRGKTSLVVAGFVGSSADYSGKKATKEDLLLNGGEKCALHPGRHQRLYPEAFVQLLRNKPNMEMLCRSNLTAPPLYLYPMALLTPDDAATWR